MLQFYADEYITSVTQQDIGYKIMSQNSSVIESKLCGLFEVQVEVNCGDKTIIRSSYLCNGIS